MHLQSPIDVENNPVPRQAPEGPGTTGPGAPARHGLTQVVPSARQDRTDSQATSMGSGHAVSQRRPRAAKSAHSSYFNINVEVMPGCRLSSSWAPMQESHMPEAVIVSVARSPIGRAFKGSLRSIRPDDLTAQIIAAALRPVPQLDLSTADDLILGCGRPGGEQGFNLARIVSVLLGTDMLPGTTITR